MRVIVGSVIGVLATGCFYVDPINERPSAEIVRDSIDLPYRGQAAKVHARFDDPDGDSVTLSWGAHACSAGGIACDAETFETGTTPDFAPVVPATRNDHTKTAVGALRITLEVIDHWGAIARPEQELVLDVQDHAPSLTLQRSGREIDNHYPVTVPIRISAGYGDLDALDKVTLKWALFAAPGSQVEMLQAWPGTPIVGVEERILVPDIEGVWTVRVTATDDQQQVTVKDISMSVAEDQPPCIGALDPGTPEATIIVDAPRRFAVLTVDDDINVYPAPPANDLFLRAAHFTWSIAGPSGGYEPITGLVSHDLVIDPANYQPGDTLDVRVDVSDSITRTLPCDPSLATCSVDGTACIQRQTWHLEIR